MIEIKYKKPKITAVELDSSSRFIHPRHIGLLILQKIVLLFFTEDKKVGIKELQENRDKIYDIASKYGAKHIRIFGSIATGQARPDSDIDFLVDLSPGRSIFDLGGLLMDLHNLLGCEVDVVTEAGLRPRIRNRVLKEAIPL